MEISPWERLDFVIEIDFSDELKHCIGIGAWAKSWQLPYTYEARFWSNMVKTLVNDHLQ